MHRRVIIHFDHKQHFFLNHSRFVSMRRLFEVVDYLTEILKV